MTTREIVAGKLNATRTLWRMIRHLHNWQPVWRGYRSSAPMPPLQFRRGFTIHHGEWDTPVLMLHEIFSEQMYSRDLRSVPDSVIVDIGANIGAVALDFAEHWPLVEIHSYEPNPQTFQSLSRNVEYNHLGGRVKLFNEAVGARNGTFDIWTGVLSVGCSGYTNEIDPGAKLVRVPCVDLQTVFARIGDRKISLLKIDAEGAEVDILGSGLSFDSVEHVAVECHDNLTPHALDKCWSILVRHGFECKMKTVAPHAGVSMVLGYKRVAGDPTQNAGRPAATQSTEAEKIPS